MPIERRDEEYAYQKLARFFVLMVSLGMVSLFAIPTVIDVPRITPLGWLELATGCGLVIGGVIWLGKVESTYRCPKCGAALPKLKPEKSTQYEYRFFRPTCDIVWTTGMHEGDG